MSEQKSEQATEQRKQKARDDGDIPISRELTSSAVLLAALLVLPAAAGEFLRLWKGAFEQSMAGALTASATAGDLLHACARPFAVTLLPVLLVLATALAGSAFLGVAQSGGVQLRVASLACGLDRISPVSHMKQVFGSRALVRLGKSLLPAAALLWLAKRSILTHLSAEPFLSSDRLPSAMTTAYQLALSSAWISVGWSAVDYVVERRNWSQKLRMSKQDIRDEARESNGNPQTKLRVRQAQRAMRRRKVKADVAQATVVLTNPTHYAVALSFDKVTMAAPRVLCKGRDLHAAEIREQARWAGVPIVENPPLARSLYRSVNEGEAIPFELYTAVAAVLAYLLRRERSTAAPAQTAPQGANQ